MNSVDELANGNAGLQGGKLARRAVIVVAAHEEDVLGADQHAKIARADVGRDQRAREVAKVNGAVRVGHAPGDDGAFGALRLAFDVLDVERGNLGARIHAPFIGGMDFDDKKGVALGAKESVAFEGGHARVFLAETLHDPSGKTRFVDR